MAKRSTSGSFPKPKQGGGPKNPSRTIASLPNTKAAKSPPKKGGVPKGATHHPPTGVVLTAGSKSKRSVSGGATQPKAFGGGKTLLKRKKLRKGKGQSGSGAVGAV